MYDIPIVVAKLSQELFFGWITGTSDYVSQRLQLQVEIFLKTLYSPLRKNVYGISNLKIFLRLSICVTLAAAM